MKNIERPEIQQVIAQDLYNTSICAALESKPSYFQPLITQYMKCETIVSPKEISEWLMKDYVPEPILDQKEHDYLEGVIRPFKNDVLIIRKRIGISVDKEFISISMKKGYGFSLPPFTKNSMYKGMELNKAYTPKELGL